VVFRRRGSDGAGDVEAIEAKLDAAEDALDDDDAKRALRLCDEALRAARHVDHGELLALTLTTRAAALADLERFADSERDAGNARLVDPESAAAAHQHGVALYRLGRFAEAAAAFTDATGMEPESAEPWHALGRCSVWLDDRDAARAAFRRAAELDSEQFVIPVRIAAAEFDRIAAEAWRTVPSGFRALLDNAMVVAQPLPDIDDVENGFDPDTLGVYEGATALHSADVPERIVLFQRNHENVCASLGALQEEIRRTILHEVGHHFGMEEGELPF
jgi:predicted Zn-dependent protease with MMP-like domain